MSGDVKGVYQLQGGIERYLQQYPDGGHWRGKNFVFDKREAISADNPNGDGGVVQKSLQQGVATICCVCAAPWDRYVGKKKCSTCGVPVLMCDKCMSNKELVRSARCPLCVQEGVTVRVEETRYTENGVKVVATEGSGISAPSVLKWGGGHASEKKRKRQCKRKACRFGGDCKRSDCLFAHPEPRTTESS